MLSNIAQARTVSTAARRAGTREPRLTKRAFSQGASSSHFLRRALMMRWPYMCASSTLLLFRSRLPHVLLVQVRDRVQHLHRDGTGRH